MGRKSRPEEPGRVVRPVGMSERGMHYIEADLDETWERDWIGVGLVELDAYLAKYAAFLEFLCARSRASAGPAPA
jgi:hypothetical protein